MRPPGKRILVVEDEPMVADSIRRLLIADGHQVVLARNAAEALDCFEHSRFDLVVADYEMPGMKGHELAAALKNLASSQAVLLISAYTEKLRRSGDFLASVDFVLTKPFSFQELRLAVQRLTEG